MHKSFVSLIFLLFLLFTCCKPTQNSSTTGRQGKIKIKYYNAIMLGDIKTKQKYEKKYYKTTKKKH